MGDFYAGIFHPLTALEDVVTFVALGILLGQQSRHAYAAIATFGVAFFVGGIEALAQPSVKAVDLINIVSVLVLGALIAAAVRLPVALYLTLAVLFGLTHGYASGAAIGPPIKAGTFLAGVGLAGFLVSFYFKLITEYVLRRNVGWMTIAVQVAGSWIAATGPRSRHELEAAAGLITSCRNPSGTTVWLQR
jgi:urease accessory protein